MSVITGQGVTAYPLPDEELSPTSKNAVSNEAVCEGLDEIKNTLSHKADVIYDTASGDIASFPDGADGLPVKDLTVAIEPVQDLHGQANPYPPGGWKNLIDDTKKYYSSNTIFLGTDSSSGVSCVLPAGTYCIWIELASGTTTNLYAIDTSTGNNLSGFPAYGVSQKSFTISEETSIRFRVYDQAATSSSFVSRAQVEAGSSKTAYAPYSNICPISGWTGANVTRTGFNIWDEEWEYDGINDTTGQNMSDSIQSRSKNYIPVVPNQAYFIKIGDGTDVDISVGTKPQIYAYAYNSNKEYIGRIPRIGTNKLAVKNSVVITPAECCYIRFKYYYTNISKLAYKHDICINVSDATKNGTYEPYNPASTTIPISWQSEAGTVYGGTLDVTSGVLTVDRAMVTADSLTGWSYNSSFDRVNTALSGAKVPSGNNYPADVFSNRFATTAISAITPTGSTNVIGISTSGNVVFRINGCSSLADYTAYFSNNSVQICYALASPNVIQLDPVTVNTLLGQNNIWADCGPSTVEYPADTKLYIDKKLAALVAALS